MKPTRKQLLDLLGGEDAGSILSSAAPELLAQVAMEGVWQIGVRVAGWESNSRDMKIGQLVFTLGDGWKQVNGAEGCDRLRIALALTFPQKQVEIVPLLGELSLLSQAGELPDLTSATGVCYLGIGEMFELLGEKAPRNLGEWYKTIEKDGRNVALGEGMVKVWATDGQLALATWAGGRKGGLVELANMVTEKVPKAQLEAKVTKLEKAYVEALELIQRLTNK